MKPNLSDVLEESVEYHVEVYLPDEQIWERQNYYPFWNLPEATAFMFLTRGPREARVVEYLVKKTVVVTREAEHGYH